MKEIMMSQHAKELCYAIKKLGEGKLTEWSLHRITGHSHGTFTAARQELCRDGILELGHEGRKPVYRLLVELDDEWLKN
ncbi:hypothetical protein [Mitsuokella sp. WILCCON 0060]|uniref:hypothetical protein n=1 Tax=Mitsuokella sp. WILCCON 0060 TaxID=3345341 RepID=UPI003F1C634B